MADDTPTILMVDDKPNNLLALETLLEDLDAQLLSASSGEQALTLLAERDIALVLLDVRMPEMDGLEVARRISGNPRSRHVPIIMVTADNARRGELLDCYRAGAVDYLNKPIEPVILLSKVRLFLELDRKSRQLERSNQALEGSLREHKRLREQNEMLLRSVGEGILSLDKHGKILYANPVADALLDHGEVLTELNFVDCIAGEGGGDVIAEMISACRDGCHWSGMIAARRYDHTFPAELTATPHTDPELGFTGVSLVIKDVSHWQLREQELRDVSERDALTGLLNRRGLDRLLVDRLCRDNPEIALLFLDLDRFKPINDSQGHKTGDEVLRNVATTLKNCTRESDVVARIGGDEFCILLHSHAPREAAGKIAEKLLDALQQPIQVEDQQFIIGASIGISVPTAGTSSSSALHHADMAMYAAKAAGRNTFRFYTAEMKDFDPVSARAPS